MLCRMELVQPALVSSTGVMEQRGITWGGTLTEGFDGGRMPEAPALAGTVVISTTADPTPAVMARPARANNLDKARAPVWCCRVTLPLPPRAQEMDQPGQRNISTRSSDGPPVPFSNVRS